MNQSYEIKQPQILERIRQIIRCMKCDFDQQEQEKLNYELVTDVKYDKINVMYKKQINQYGQQIEQKTIKMKQLEETCKKIEGEQNNKCKKQVRKYMEIIGEKEAQLSVMRKQSVAFKNKVTSLQNQCLMLNQSRDNLQRFVCKAIQQMKGNLKQLASTIDQIQMQKIVIESKQRQAEDKMDIITNNCNEIQSNNKKLQKNYLKMKKSFQDISNELMDAKFDLEKNKVKKKEEIKQFLPPQENDILPQLIEQINMIGQLTRQINSQEKFQASIQTQQDLNKELISENMQMRQKIQTLQSEIINLKSKIDSYYEDKITQQKKPSIFQYLRTKASQLQKFQEKVLILEEYIEKKDEAICKLLEKIQLHSKEDIQKVQQERDKLKKKVINLENENKNLEQMCHSYKTQILELVQTYEDGKRKKKRKKLRCIECLLGIDGQSQFEKCEDCQKLLHPECLYTHSCDANREKNGQKF